MIEQIINSINVLNEFEDSKDQLVQELSTCDLKEQDILHYIELEKFNCVDGYKLAKKLKEIRQERRKIKDKLDLINIFQNHSNKLINSSNRKFLITTLNKENKKLLEREYRYKVIEKENIKE